MVGSADPDEVYDAARSAEQRLGREVNVRQVSLDVWEGPAEDAFLRSLRSRPLVVIELDPELCGRLRDRFRDAPNVEVVLGDATKFGEVLAARGIPKVDHVLSGLPLPSFPAVARDAILETSAKTIAEGGTFRQLTVMPLIYYKMYRRYFEDVRFRFVPFNLNRTSSKNRRYIL